MDRLAYITRGNKSPQGIPRVYFCCHPQDTDLYLPTIAEQILEISDCAIWYDTTPEVPTDAVFYESLSQMQLFLVPVTSRFLMQENKGLACEFLYASQNHIPILPLMQEPGLDTLFNTKCGELQYLDSNNTDTTAISYQDKLKKYLSAVLIGNEIAERIRQTFDAYIFLSYRKKDRKYANQLMRLIHQNPLYEDIAIWYDEFLVPGEGFNEGIFEFLAKSPLFLLTVTPNLLEENNYVLLHEYPTAKNMQKIILPVEMVDTDADELSRKYDSLPPVMNPSDSVRFHRWLEDSIKNISLREHNASAQHRFLIGLAYLSGIDVEVDFKRAHAMIERAAQDDLPEAIKKLVSMYRYGEGIEKDYTKAIIWQRKLIDIYEKDFNASNSYENALNWITEIHELLLFHISLYDYESAMTQCRTIQTILDNPRIKTFSFVPRYRLINSSLKGDILYKSGLVNEAITEYQNALSLLDESIFKNEDLANNLSVFHDRIGIIFREQAKLPEALTHFQESYELRIDTVKNNPSEASRYAMVAANINLGNSFLDLGYFEESRKHYNEALNSMQILALENPTDKYQMSLAECFYNLAKLCQTKNQHTDAIQFYISALEIYEKLTNAAGTPKQYYYYSVCCLMLGDCYFENHQSNEAIQYYQMMHETVSNWSLTSESLEFQRLCAVSYTKTGDILLRQRNATSALEKYEQALNIFKHISKQSESLNAQLDLSSCYEQIGGLYDACGLYDDSLENYKECYALRKRLYDENPSNNTHRVLGLVCGHLGDVYKKKEQLDDSLLWFHKMEDIFSIIFLENESIDAKDNLSTAYNRLSKIYAQKQEPEKARDYSLMALDIAKTIAGQTKTVSAYNSLSIAYYQAAKLACQKDAITYLQTAINIWQQLHTQFPDETDFTKFLRIASSELEELSATK